jgi:5'-methylthioadenosine phosphorylase
MSAGVAIIGGSGFYDIDDLSDIETLQADTPFGRPSDPITIGTVHGRTVAFLPRHGVGHRLLPAEVPVHANIWALKRLGVERIISVSAVGSMQEAIEPLHMLVPDQLIDRTRGRRSTFFGRGLVAHIAFDAPFCPELSETLFRAAQASRTVAHKGGTYLAMEGPAFSTRAESLLYRSWGADVVGMTALPEAKLAREAEICYATLALVTDYDTWHESHETVSSQLIVENLNANVSVARQVLSEAVRTLPAGRSCACSSALSNAIVTPLDLVPDETKRELAPIVGRYLQQQEASRVHG